MIRAGRAEEAVRAGTQFSTIGIRSMVALIDSGTQVLRAGDAYAIQVSGIQQKFQLMIRALEAATGTNLGGESAERTEMLEALQDLVNTAGNPQQDAVLIEEPVAFSD